MDIDNQVDRHGPIPLICGYIMSKCAQMQNIIYQMNIITETEYYYRSLTTKQLKTSFKTQPARLNFQRGHKMHPTPR